MKLKTPTPFERKINMESTHMKNTATRKQFGGFLDETITDNGKSPFKHDDIPRVINLEQQEQQKNPDSRH